MEDSILYQAGHALWKKVPGIAISSKGASGGIATFWDSTKFELTKEERNDHWIFTNLLHWDSRQQVSLFNLYVPNLFPEKCSYWDSLELFLSQHSPRNIIIAGDLNVTLSTEEKKWGSIVRDQAREWVDIILHWDLMDVKPPSGKFT